MNTVYERLGTKCLAPSIKTLLAIKMASLIFSDKSLMPKVSFVNTVYQRSCTTCSAPRIKSRKGKTASHVFHWQSLIPRGSFANHYL
jgi:hypothetical protein